MGTPKRGNPKAGIPKTIVGKNRNIPTRGLRSSHIPTCLGVPCFGVPILVPVEKETDTSKNRASHDAGPDLRRMGQDDTCFLVRACSSLLAGLILLCARYFGSALQHPLGTSSDPSETKEAQTSTSLGARLCSSAILPLRFPTGLPEARAHFSLLL